MLCVVFGEKRTQLITPSEQDRRRGGERGKTIEKRSKKSGHAVSGCAIRRLAVRKRERGERGRRRRNWSKPRFLSLLIDESNEEGRRSTIASRTMLCVCRKEGRSWKGRK